MGLTEEQQLIFIQAKFREKVEAQTTMVEMTNFITNITPANVRTFLQNKLQGLADSTRVKSGELIALADDIETLKDSL